MSLDLIKQMKDLVSHRKKESIRNLLMNTTSRQDAILEMQKRDAIDMPRIAPALCFLDALDIERSVVNKSVLNTLKSTLLDRIPLLGRDLLLQLLNGCLLFCQIDDFSQIIVKIFEVLEEIPSEYLNSLSQNESAFQKMPFEIKRRVWEVSSDRFLCEFVPLVDQFVSDNNSSTAAESIFSLYFERYVFPKSRRNVNAILQQVLKLIGDSEKLYSLSMRYLNDRFVKTFDISLSLLRSDITMGLWDKNFQKSINADNFFPLIQCLDFCIKENKLNSSHIDQLKKIILAVPAESRFISEAALIFANPLYQSFLARVVSARLEAIVATEILPKEDSALKFVSDMLLFSLNYQTVISTKSTDFDKNQPQLFTSFYPMLALMILEDKHSTDSVISPVLKDIANTYPLPRRILLHFFIEIAYKNQFKRASSLANVLFDEDCFHLSDDLFVNSLFKALSTKLKEVGDLEIRISLLKPFAFVSMYSLKAHISSLKLILLLRDQKVFSEKTLVDFYSVLKEKGFIEEGAKSELEALYKDVEKVLKA